MAYGDNGGDEDGMGDGRWEMGDGSRLSWSLKRTPPRRVVFTFDRKTIPHQQLSKSLLHADAAGPGAYLHEAAEQTAQETEALQCVGTAGGESAVGAGVRHGGRRRCWWVAELPLRRRRASGAPQQHPRNACVGRPDVPQQHPSAPIAVVVAMRPQPLGAAARGACGPLRLRGRGLLTA